MWNLKKNFIGKRFVVIRGRGRVNWIKMVKRYKLLVLR